MAKILTNQEYTAGPGGAVLVSVINVANNTTPVHLEIEKLGDVEDFSIEFIGNASNLIDPVTQINVHLEEGDIVRENANLWLSIDTTPYSNGSSEY